MPDIADKPVEHSSVSNSVRVGLYSLALVCLILGSWNRSVSGSREAGRTASCQSNIKQQALAARMYCQDWDETMPQSAAWMDTLSPYVTQRLSPSIESNSIFRCPDLIGSDKSKAREVYGYAFNERISHQKLNVVKSPAEAIMIFESASQFRNATDPLFSVQNPGRHREYDTIGLIDGHVKSLTYDNIDRLRHTMERNEPWFTPHIK